MYDEKELFFENKLRIEKFLDNLLSIKTPNKLQEAMRYSVLVGGKRLRPSLTYITSELGPKQIKSETEKINPLREKNIGKQGLIKESIDHLNN